MNATLPMVLDRDETVRQKFGILCCVCTHFRCAEVFADFLLGGIVSGADAGARQLSLALLGQIDMQPSFGSLIRRCLDLMRPGNMLNGYVACG